MTQQIAGCSQIGGLLTVGSGAPANAASFAGRQFYFDSVTNGLYALSGGVIYAPGVSTTPPSSLGKVWQVVEPAKRSRSMYFHPTTGSDSNSGTETSPKRTISGSIAAIQATGGDIDLIYLDCDVTGQAPIYENWGDPTKRLPPGVTIRAKNWRKSIFQINGNAFTIDYCRDLIIWGLVTTSTGDPSGNGWITYGYDCDGLQVLGNLMDNVGDGLQPNNDQVFYGSSGSSVSARPRNTTIMWNDIRNTKPVMNLGAALQLYSNNGGYQQVNLKFRYNIIRGLWWWGMIMEAGYTTTDVVNLDVQDNDFRVDLQNHTSSAGLNFYAPRPLGGVYGGMDASAVFKNNVLSFENAAIAVIARYPAPVREHNPTVVNNIIFSGGKPVTNNFTLDSSNTVVTSKSQLPPDPVIIGPSTTSTNTALKRLLVIGSSVRRGSGVNEPTYVSTRGPLYLNAQAAGITLTPVGIYNETTRQGTPGQMSAQGGARLVTAASSGVDTIQTLVTKSKAVVADGADLLITIEGGLNDFGQISDAQIAADTLAVGRYARSLYPQATIVLEGIGASTWIPPATRATVKASAQDVFVAENPRNFAIDSYAISYTSSDFTDGTHPSLDGAIRMGADIWRQLVGLGLFAVTVTPPGSTVDATSVTAVTVATGLDKPWAVQQLPDGKFLVTEKAAGTIKLINGLTKTNVSGVPAIFYGTGDQHGGMMDLILDSNFVSNRTIYFTYVQGTQSANAMRVAKATLSADGLSMSNVTTLLTVSPAIAGTSQYGGRLAEGLDGTLFITAGDRDGPHDANGAETAQMRTAQDLTVQNGKVLRINKDGSIPSDNPYASSSNVNQRAVYARGFRNELGAAVAPDGKLWINENLAQGGDEINRVLPGLNYGWPYQSYGSHYGGASIPDVVSGMEPPVWYSAQAIAPSGMAFIKGNTYGPGWAGNIIFGSLADYTGTGGRRVNRLLLNSAGTGVQGGQTAARTTLYGGGTGGPRCRDVRQGTADGKLYVLTDDGSLIRLDPVFPAGSGGGTGGGSGSTAINDVQTMIDDMTTWSDGTAGGTVNPLYAPRQNFLIGCCGLPATQKPAFIILGAEGKYSNAVAYVQNDCTYSGWKGNFRWDYWMLFTLLFEGLGNQSNNVGLEIQNAGMWYRRKADGIWLRAYGGNAYNWFTVDPQTLAYRSPQGSIVTRTNAAGNQVLRLYQRNGGGGDNLYHATLASQSGGVTANGSFNAKAILDAGIDAIWGKVNLQLVPWDSSQSIGNHEWYAYTGGDSYPTPNYGPYNGNCGAATYFAPPAIASGRMKRLSTSFRVNQFVTLSEARLDCLDASKTTITSASLRANPPTAAQFLM